MTDDDGGFIRAAGGVPSGDEAWARAQRLTALRRQRMLLQQVSERVSTSAARVPPLGAPAWMSEAALRYAERAADLRRDLARVGWAIDHALAVVDHTIGQLSARE